MKFLPEVVEAEFAGKHCIGLTFNDGTEKVVDFTELLHGPVFEPLKKPAYFKRFFLDGGTVCWPNGADIAPETLHAAPGIKFRAERQSRPNNEANGLARAV